MNKTILLASPIWLLTLSACNGNLENIRDPDFSMGCIVVEADARLGTLNNQGMAQACKVKCSEQLPKNYHYFYENSRTGCKVEIGKK